MLDSMQRSFTASSSSTNFVGANKDDLCAASSSSSSSLLEQQTHLYLSRIDHFPVVSNKWNTNEEIASILLSVEYHPEWITKSVQTRPTNGSLLIYHKKECNYKQDGYLWKTRKVGKLPREDHMRLKVKGVESIYANYVHSALVPTFHRRSYWLLTNPEYVLVHYLNVPNEIDQQHERLVLSLRQYGSNLSRQEILDQLQPMLCYGEELSSSISAASGETSHNDTVEQLNWLNSLIDESRKPKFTPRPLSAAMPSTKTSGGGNPVPTNFLLVGYDVNSMQNLSESSTSPRPLLVSIEPSITGTTVDGSGPSAVILATTSSSPITVVTAATSSVNVPDGGKSVMMNGGGCQQQQQSNDHETHQQHQQCVVNARSNSCGSASRKIFSALSLKRQPSAFSDGAQDVFLPDYATTPNNDSAYCSFADCSSSDDVRIVQHGNVHGHTSLNRAAADPLLASSALNGVAYHDSDVETTNLGLSREEINEILKVNFVDSNDDAQMTSNGYDPNGVVSDCFGDGAFPAFRLFGNYLNNYDTSDVVATTNSECVMQISCSTTAVDKTATPYEATSTNDSRRSSCTSAASCGVASATTDTTTTTLRSFSNTLVEPCITNVVATITEYSPDWSYIEGGVKILISGPWYSCHHGYKCKFDTELVPAVFVQSGVLRCHCPPHEPGIVSLCVLCDDQVISNSVTFSYVERKSSFDFRDFSSTINVKNPDFWISANDNHFANGLLERLYFLESRLSSHNRTNCRDSNFNNTAINASTLDFIDLEKRFVGLIEKMSTFDWLQPVGGKCNDRFFDNLLSHHCGLTLLHYCAVLGFVDLITALCRWYNKKPNDLLKTELDPTKCDVNGRTPLMWSCVRGRVAASIMLARWYRDSLFTSDKQFSELPLALAYRQGHLQLIKEVVEQFVREANGDLSGKDLDTALWVLTGGLVERSQLFGRVVQNRRICSKQLSLDALVQQQRSTTTTTVLRGERAKRSSVEGVDDLIRTTDDCVSCKLTKQNSREESVHAVEEWLKQPLSVDVPMDLASSVPDSTGMAWESLTDSRSECCMEEVCPAGAGGGGGGGCGVGGGGGGGGGGTTLGVEIASLAQEIIDALPDRIKADMFFEETQEDEAFAALSSSSNNKDHQPSCLGVANDNNNNAYNNNDDDESSLKDFHAHSMRLPVEAQLSPLSPNVSAWHNRHSSDTPSSSTHGGDIFNFHYLDCETPSPVSSTWIQQSQIGSSINAGGNCLTNLFNDADLSSSSSNFRKCSTPSNRTTDLGAFFNASRSRSPLECHFQELTLSDREQRELYEAAKVIQNAFRQYKKRVQNQRQIEMERHAATVIQTYYRRYKQYCYFKKLHHAAALIQKHFRLYKASKRKSVSSLSSTEKTTTTTLHLRTTKNAAKTDHNYDTTSHAFMNSSSTCDCVIVGDASCRTTTVSNGKSGANGCIRIAVTPDELRLWKRQLAAIRIQHAFRGHIKRQAAARTIQRFMRQSKQKLQKARTTGSIADTTELTTSPLGYLNTHLND